MSARSAAWWLALAVVAGPGQAEPVAVAARCDAHYVAPHQPQRLTRSLTRTLSDGKQIVTSRSYLVRFSRQGAGWRVDGEQVDVQVDSPPPLAALAALERARIDKETLPITLDRDGRIVPGPPRVGPAAAPANTQAVNDMLAKAHLTPAQRATVKAMSHAMLAPGAAVATPWPQDVFAAAPGTRQEAKHLVLPDGTQGDVTITITASHPDCGHDARPASRRMERAVVTQLGGTARQTREVWTLEPAVSTP